VYGENSVGRGEYTMYAPQVSQQKLVITNDGGNFAMVTKKQKT
jgi:hypothetical protein